MKLTKNTNRIRVELNTIKDRAIYEKQVDGTWVDVNHPFHKLKHTHKEFQAILRKHDQHGHQIYDESEDDDVEDENLTFKVDALGKLSLIRKDDPE